MSRSEIYAAIREVVGCKQDEFDAEGDEWLSRPNPDEASLDVDYLTDALETLFDSMLRQARA